MTVNNNEERIVCAVVLLNSNYEALLQLRDEKPGLRASGLWVFPGGHREPGEDLFSCARREFIEETGYECNHLNWLMSIDDIFTDPETVLLQIFWDFYDVNKSYICLEGQSLQFMPRNKAFDVKMPHYLIHIWDLAILAAKPKKYYSNSTIN